MSKIQPIINKSNPPSAILVAVSNKSEHESKIKENITELSLLSKTQGLVTLKVFTQKLDKPDNRTFVGKGKLQEIKNYIDAKSIDVIVFDDDLSPSQLRNLENEIKIKIYDRSLLILDIFLMRAQTAQAKTQVELARFQYLLPRLTRMWTHLERQRGGTGTRGGAGEKEIETDRRMIRDRISLLKKQLEKVDKQSLNRRKSRKGIVRVALVGYTNAGKSTIMRLLSKEKVYAKDELFATLDSTVRKVVIDHVPFLLSDTVGFIRKLPHGLIVSFRSTLAEVKEADLLLHVIDASNPAMDDHIEVVENTLQEIGASTIPSIRIYNKMDKMDNPEDDHNMSIYVSAKKSTNIDKLKTLIIEKVLTMHLRIFPNFIKDHPHKFLKKGYTSMDFD